MSQTPVETNPLSASIAARRADTWRTLAVCGLLLLGVLVLFARAARQGFFNVDDNFFIYNEPHVTAGLSWSGVVWAFTNGPLGEWYPLTMLSHMLDCQFFGLKPAGHHVTNVLQHAASTVGLFLVLRRMTNAFWPSAVVAALFAFHPLHVEPVVWLSQRRDVLSGLFFVLTLWAYDEYARHPRSVLRYLLVAAMLAFGLMSKAILVTVPALLLLLDFWPLRRFYWSVGQPAAAAPFPALSTKRLIAEKLPLFALCLADALVTFQTHGLPPDSLTFSERLANAIVSCAVYLGQLFVPVGLSIFNAYPEAGRPAWEVAGALAVLLVITGAAAIGWRRYPYLLVGWLWYLGLLVPVLGLVFVGPQARADRYTYLSQIGLYIALIWGAVELGGRWPARRWVIGIVGSAAILAALWACSWRQVGLWQSNRVLWEHALACDPTSATTHVLLGLVLQDEEHDDVGAAEQYRQTLPIVPGGRNIYNWARAVAHYRLGLFAAREGDVPAALAHYEQALESDKKYELARVGLAIGLARLGRLDEAVEQFKQTIALAPNCAPAIRCNLGTALLAQGKTDEAIAVFTEALKRDPSLIVAHVSLATVAANRGQTDEAIAHLRHAIEIEPSDSGLSDSLAELLRQKGEFGQAAEVERRRRAAKRLEH